MGLGMIWGYDDLENIREAEAIVEENNFWQAIAGEQEPGDDAYGRFANDVLPFLEGQNVREETGSTSRLIPTTLEDAPFPPDLTIGLSDSFGGRAFFTPSGTSSFQPGTTNGTLRPEFIAQMQLAHSGDTSLVLQEELNPPTDTFAIRTFTAKNIGVVAGAVFVVTFVLNMIWEILRGIRYLFRRRRAKKLRQRHEKTHPRAATIRQLKEQLQLAETLNLPRAEKTVIKQEIEETLSAIMATYDGVPSERDRAQAIREDLQLIERQVLDKTEIRDTPRQGASIR